MRFVSLRLKNWRNFLNADVELARRVFLVGPNASGKSNLLDSIRFLRDIADVQGGFQRAVRSRGGVSQIRSLHARQAPRVEIDVQVDLEDGKLWRYLIEFTQDNQQVPILYRELVEHGGVELRSRPDDDDLKDKNRLTQTHLEQVSANQPFRTLAEFFAGVRYLHLIPTLVREPERSLGRPHDPYGGDFLEQLAQTPSRTLTSRLRRINDALRVAVPQLETLDLQRDSRGVPHLRGLYKHWRPNAGWQSEVQFSDGTLRLLGLLWVFLDGTEPLLLEEPEMSLHAAVVREIPRMMARLGRRYGRQVLVSTHSADLLADESIGAEEVLLLIPTEEGTRIASATGDEEIKTLLQNGVPIGEILLAKTAPQNAVQLSLFGD